MVSGPSEVHIEEGSKLALECHVRFAASPPVYIFWYHNSTMVNYARQDSLEVRVDLVLGMLLRWFWRCVCVLRLFLK